ncbi:DUF7511 domain-containing protein [Halegenticoccus soli]
MKERPTGNTDDPTTGIDAADQYEHITIRNEDSMVECTILPCNCSSAELVTHWLTASGDSFVSLQEMQ